MDAGTSAVRVDEVADRRRSKVDRVGPGAPEQV